MLLEHLAFLALLVGTEAFFTVLSALNVRHAERTVESERDWLEDTLDVDDPDEMLDYTRVRTGFSTLRVWVRLGALLLVLYSGVFADAVSLVESMGWSPLVSGLAFFLGLIFLLQVASIPFDLVDTFVIEEAFDFNQQSLRLWARDWVLGTGIGLAVGGVLVGAILLVIELLPQWWWIAAIGIFAVFSLVMQVLVPRVIMPLFYDFDPIDAGELREAVEDVFDRAGFTASGIYVMDASRRSSKSNAFFMGFGRTKRVALFDTLIDQLDRAEIQGVLAHELAHWKKAHVWKQLAASLLQTGVLLAILGYLVDAPWVYEMFGVTPDVTYAGLVLGALWVTPLSRWLSPLGNRLSIRHEYEADDFAREVMGDGESLVSGLSEITTENLGNPFPHPLYATFHYDHPPLPQRIRHLRDADGTADVSE